MKTILAFLLLLPTLALGDVVVRGGGTSNQQKVDANGSAQATGPTDPTLPGYTKVSGKEGEPLRVTASGYLQVSTENLEFFDTIDGATVNTNLWTQSASTMTITQASSFLNLNPANSLATGVYAIISSIQNFTTTNTNPLYLRLLSQSSITNLPANTTAEFGWGTVATTSAPTDGVFVRYQAGNAYLVTSNGGSETTQTFTLPDTTTHEFWFHVYASRAKLFVDGTKVAEVAAPGSLPALVNTARQPVFFRVYNGGSAPASSPTLKLGSISVQNINAEFVKPWADKLTGFGRGGYQHPTTYGQTSNHANSASPTSATLSNTAAGYTTLGGRYQFAAPAGAVTDFALFGFQVPAGYQMYCDRIRISACNTGAAVATTATLLDWSLGVNASAVSLATTDGAGTWAPRRIPLGMHGFPLAAPRGPAQIGDCAADIVQTGRWVVDGGRFLHVIVQVPVGTATGSQVIRGDVLLNCWSE